MITVVLTPDDARCIREIKSTVAMAKAFNNMKTLVTGKMNLNLWKKLLSAAFGA